MSVSEIDGQMAGWRSTHMRQNHPNKLAKIERCLDAVKARIGNGSLLDVGCGCGEVYKQLKHSNYHGIDIDAGEIEKAKDSFPDGSFAVGDLFGELGEWDYVLCSRVLLHVPLDAGMKSLLKAAKKSLFLILNIGPDSLEIEETPSSKTFFRTISKRSLDAYGQCEVQTFPRNKYSLVTYER